MHHIYHPITGKKETLATLLAGSTGEVWNKALSNEFVRLAQGNARVSLPRAQSRSFPVMNYPLIAMLLILLSFVIIGPYNQNHIVFVLLLEGIN